MTTAAPGFFGKVPAKGDFVSARVPAGLGHGWDAWLGHFTVWVREAAGAAWPEAWLTAPLWHFALGPGTLGPVAAAGALVASVDRVGRMFPFTIVGPSAGLPPAEWSDQIETLILAALEDGFDPALLDRDLLRVGAPVGTGLLEAGHSVWWCRGSDRVPPSRLVLEGLPAADAAIAMVLGRV